MFGSQKIAVHLVAGLGNAVAVLSPGVDHFMDGTQSPIGFVARAFASMAAVYFGVVLWCRRVLTYLVNTVRVFKQASAWCSLHTITRKSPREIYSLPQTVNSVLLCSIVCTVVVVQIDRQQWNSALTFRDEGACKLLRSFMCGPSVQVPSFTTVSVCINATVPL